MTPNPTPSTDWHCHLLPGIDDGPNGMDEAVAMAAGLHKLGFARVCCTPHLIKGAYEADDREVQSALIALQQRLAEENIALDLLPGREYYLDEFLLDYLRTPLTLGGSRSIMIEFPNHASAELVQTACFQIRRSGYTPLIAHPERCRLFAVPEKLKDSWFSRIRNQSSRPKTDAPSLLSYLLDIGCQFQGNLGSFAGNYGEAVRSCAEELRRLGIYTCFGTDAHSLPAVKSITEKWLYGPQYVV